NRLLMQIIQPSDYSSTHYYTHPHPSPKFHLETDMATVIGFSIMVFIGLFVKFIHIPVNNITVGG
uniref:Uncharacterized protein n=1 Tax=Neolamprologus brichardi TaxID=32507 RepID=A0A3Q4GCQ6_NEOBR